MHLNIFKGFREDTKNIRKQNRGYRVFWDIFGEYKRFVAKLGGWERSTLPFRKQVQGVQRPKVA